MKTIEAVISLIGRHAFGSAFCVNSWFASGKVAMACLFALAVIGGTKHASAHDDSSYPAAANALPPIILLQNGEERTIRLTEVYDYHGGSCPGATMAFQSMRYALELLFDQETPVAEDLVIIARMPGGPIDFFDIIMKGDEPGPPTQTPAGMSRGMDNFVFQFLRKSTMEAVTIELKKGLWPADWYELKRKKKAGTMTEADKARQQADKEAILSQLLEKPFSDNFANPQVHSFLVWGQVLPGENDASIGIKNTKAQK